MPVIPALWKQRQLQICEFEAIFKLHIKFQDSQNYIGRPCLERKTEEGKSILPPGGKKKKGHWRNITPRDPSPSMEKQQILTSHLRFAVGYKFYPLDSISIEKVEQGPVSVFFCQASMLGI